MLAGGALAFAEPAAPATSAFRIVIFKKERELWLVRGDQVIRRYTVSLGRSPEGTKAWRGDNKTPVGTYVISDKKADSTYHRFLGINYPNVHDADRAFADGRIDADTWANIWLAERRGSAPPTDTPLGARVGIHGIGARTPEEKRRRVHDWTRGCVALSDRDVEELFELVPVGTPVEIFETSAK